MSVYRARSNRSRNPLLLVCCLALAIALPRVEAGELPFEHRVTVYRDADGRTLAFSLQLEQPFLAEEFERSNYLRLHSLDDKAYLIYPRETRFEQKHAVFVGRLRDSGTARVRLEYETVTENLDGSRRVEVQHGEIEIPIPDEETGVASVFHEWAERQNDHFRRLLAYYPSETFLQYVLLQSGDRYGIDAPTLPRRAVSRGSVETSLYQIATGSLAIQQSLQQQSLQTSAGPEDLTTHISRLTPPELLSLDYAERLARQKDAGLAPAIPDLARFVPADCYLLHFNAVSAAGELFDLSEDWGGNLLRLFRPQARDSHLQTKFQRQLLLRRDGLARLFEDEVIADLAISGSDLYFSEGTDVAVLVRLKRAAAFDALAETWRAGARSDHPDLVERTFNYRGQRVDVAYTPDRAVSSFRVRHGDLAIHANSHVAIRRMIDTLAGDVPSLHAAEDFAYVTTLLPPGGDDASGYFFASEAFLRRQVGPAMKISEKRRKQCFNNLVMLSNASLLYRMEFGRSPQSLSELIAGRFIDPSRLICPHGGSYTFDAGDDVGTCSLHNRLKYMTPNVELQVLRVSETERREYDRYKERYAAFWQPLFDPVAIRMHVTPERVRLEGCVLPLANGSLYTEMRDWLGSRARDGLAAPRARSSIASVAAVFEPEQIGAVMRAIPGMDEVLASDPTLTDLGWLGERVALHVCDADQILQVDPQFLQPLQLFGQVGLVEQSVAALAVTATSLPTYVAVEVHDRQRAQRCLQLLTSKVLLRDQRVWVFDTEFDAYRLPDYRETANYVLSFRLYALKLRLHVALVGDQLIAATTRDALHEVIDAAAAPVVAGGDVAHLQMQLSPTALNEFRQDLHMYWAESSRRACHDNIMSLHHLVTLYGVAIDAVDPLSEAKYGVTCYCPEGGRYEYDPGRDEVRCSVHGNRQHARQGLGLERGSSFARFMDRLERVDARLRYEDESLRAIVTIDLAGADDGVER